MEHGFKPLSADEATRKADMVNILLPDEIQADVYRQHIAQHLQPGNVLMCSHGFNIHFGQIEPPKGVDALLVAPKGRDTWSAASSSKAAACPASSRSTTASKTETLQLGLAYAKGIGGTRGGVIQTTFAEETETDLFGEQVVLCGGVSELVRAGFETLVEAGYQPEMAYFECLHELKLIVDLFYQGGLNYMRYSVSNTAEYGDYTRGPADHHRADQGNEEDPGRGSQRPVRQGVDPGRSRADAAFKAVAGSRDRGSRRSCKDLVDQREGSVVSP